MADKLWFLLPEIWLFAAMCVVAVMGLARSRRLRQAVPFVTAAALLAAMVMVPLVYADEARLARAGLLMPMLGKYVKIIVCGLGAVFALLNAGVMDRPLEQALAAGRTEFDPLRVARGEYFSFLLLSLIGVMLCSNANDLIWLFLALELTSLPTYIMIAMSRGSRKAQEAAMKYFFLGAMASAMFLYGFALLYASTGTIVLTDMQRAFSEQAAAGGINPFGMVGMILAILGICYKLGAAPMHFYIADVYEGAAAPVTAFIAFVPKTAGMLALMLLLGTMGWSGHNSDGAPGLPGEIVTVLWMVAVLTMTLGNIGAILQSSAKRVLAYSSIAHSGYMLIGIIVGPAASGIEAVLFYLLAYGIMNTAAFGVLAGLERKGREIESMDDLAGLRVRHPLMAVAMALAAGSLLGIPPLLGFWSKLYIFMAGVEGNQIPLVVIACLNSAISAWYYLRFIALPVISKPSAQSDTVVAGPVVWPRIAAMVTALAVLLLPIFAQQLVNASRAATDQYLTSALAGNSRSASVESAP